MGNSEWSHRGDSDPMNNGLLWLEKSTQLILPGKFFFDGVVKKFDLLLVVCPVVILNILHIALYP